MPSDLQSRTQYLDLAEFCQRVISSLADYLEGTQPIPTETLQNAVAALQSVRSGDPYRFGQKTAAALGSYEQVRTLEECWKTPQQIATVADLTAAVLRNEDLTEQRADARKVIELFSTLQKKALWNFERPRHSAPTDLLELCRTFKAV